MVQNEYMDIEMDSHKYFAGEQLMRKPTKGDARHKKKSFTERHVGETWPNIHHHHDLDHHHERNSLLYSHYHNGENGNHHKSNISYTSLEIVDEDVGNININK